MVRIPSHSFISDNRKSSICKVPQDLLSLAREHFEEISEPLLLSTALTLTLAKWSYDEFQIVYSDDLLRTGIFESQILARDMNIEAWFSYCTKKLTESTQEKQDLITLQNERNIFVTFSNYENEPLIDEIHFSFIKKGDGYEVVCSWGREDPFSQWDIFFERFILLLEDIAKQGKKIISEYSFLTTIEKDIVEKKLEFNDFLRNQEISIIQAFSEIVSNYPTNVAIDRDDLKITYEELDKLSTSFALELASKGVSAGQYLAVILDDHLEFVIATLAILKVGCTSIPIDVDFPIERIQFILDDSKASAVISQTKIKNKISNFLCIPHILIDIDLLYSERDNSLELKAISNKSSIACVMYTSGSTGRPKGVCITHKNILALSKYAFPNKFTTKDCFLNSANVTFDASLFNLWCALLNGSRYVVISKCTLLDAAELELILKQKKVTIFMLATSLFHQLVLDRANIFSSVDMLFVGGEQLQEHVIQKMDGVLPKKLLHAYGPTECTTYATTFLVTAHTNDVIPIGKALPYAQLFVLDRFRNPLPRGLIGELFITGLGVSAGYLNAVERTNKVFIPNIIRSKSSHIFYKTGDLVYVDRNEDYVFWGRKDRQVKIAGHRIELFEVEKQVLSYPKIQQCVALVVEGRNHHSRLVLFYCTENLDFDESHFQTYLFNRLPAYMIPKRYYRVERFPLTATGKIDIQQLHSLALAESNTSNSQAVTALEHPREMLKAIWEYYLQAPRVNENDNFFSLGGDSITAIQISSAAREKGIIFQPTLLLESDSLDDLLNKAIIAPVSNEKQFSVIGSEYFSLSPIQKWFFNMALPNPDFFTMSYYIKCDRPVSFDVVQKAFKVVLLNHPAFFMNFSEVRGEYQQKYLIPSNLNEKTVIEKMRVPSCLSVEDRKIFLKTQALRIQNQLNLQNPPLIKAIFFEEDNQSLPTLFIAVHHVIMDGISWRIFLEDLSIAYDAIDNHYEPSFLSESCSFQGWIAALKNYHIPTETINYWKDVTQSEWAPLIKDGMAGVEGDLLTLSSLIDEGTTKQLIVQAAAYLDISINAVLIGTLFMAIKETFGLEKVTIDIEGHGRESISNQIDNSRTVGWFTTLYPVTLTSSSYFQYDADFNEKQKIITFLQEKHHFLSSIPLRGFDYLLLQSTGLLSKKPQPQVKFNYLGRFQEDRNNLFSFDTENTISQLAENNVWPYLLDVELSIVDEKLKVSFKYNASHIEQTLIEKLSKSYLKAISGISDIVKAFPHEEIIRYNNHHIVNKKSRIMRLNRRTCTLYPLLPMQASLLFHTVSSSSSRCYIVQSIISINRSIDLNTLKEALIQLTKKKSALRAFFKKNDMGEFSYAISKSVELVWQVIDLSMSNEMEQKQEVDKALEEDREQGFDIQVPPLFRIRLFSLKEDRLKLLLSFHHLILDGWSVSLFLKNLNAAYLSLLTGETLSLQDDEKYHKLYIDWTQSRDSYLATTYWKNYLKGVDEITTIPFYHELDKTFKLFSQENERYSVEKSLYISDQQLENTLKTNKITLNTVMLAGLGLLLQYLTGKDELLVGVVTAIRPSEIVGSMNAMGLYINSLPFKFKIHNHKCLNELYQDIQRTLHAHLDHAFYPLHQIKNSSSLAQKDRIFDILFVFENYPSEKIDANKNIIGDIKTIEELDIPLTICIKKLKNEEYTVSAMSHKPIYPQEFIEKTVDLYIFYIEQLMSDAYKQISEVKKISKDEQKRLVTLSAQPTSSYPSSSRLEELISLQARQTPDAISVVDNVVQWTYLRLQQKIKQYAIHLSQRGDSQIIAVALNRRVELVATILGILETGAAFLPLDVKLPPKRLEKILTLSKAKVIVTDEEHKNLFNNLNITVLTLQQLEEEVSPNLMVLNKPKHSSAEDVAYIIYTSGSTGEPKGVMGSHRALINRLWWMIKYLPVVDKDRFLQKTTISFDVSLWEMFEPLLVGGTLVLAEPDRQNDPFYLVDIIKEQKISIIHFVPSMLKMFLQTLDAHLIKQNCVSLRAVICSGEALTPEIANAFNQVFDNAILYNFYGPTEAAIEVAYWKCPKEEVITRVPIGKAISNTKLYIVNEKREILPEGVIGELVISGDSVANGYLYNEVLSNERFDINPYEKSRVYYTGDLACMDPKGLIYYLGRKDEQIKIRGFRVELGEIQQALLQHDNISLAAVFYDASEDDERLVAFIVEKAPITEEVKKIKTYNKFLASILPHYMLPHYYISLTHLPFTQSGKINKKELLSLLPKKTKMIKEAHVSTSITELVKKLCEIALGLEHIDWDDNFFDLGGHSLTALKLMALIESKIHIQINVSDIFYHPLIRDFAYLVSQKRTQGPNIKMDMKKVTHYVTSIRQMKGAPNLFLIHPIGGTIYRFQALNEYLSANWNIYAIEDPGLHSNQYFFSTLEAMAEFYIQQIKKIQPSGTYYLGGLSIGGTIAVEMAVQLKSQGDKVGPVILFDAWAKYPPEVNSVEYVDQYINTQYAQLEKVLEADVFKKIPQPQLIVHRQRAKLLEAYKISKQNFPEIALFKAIDLLPALKGVDDPQNYWQEYTSKAIMTYRIPGDHDSMFSHKNIKVLSKKFDEYLNLLNSRIKKSTKKPQVLI